eukprot:4506877-Amphidinium_carterae.2
MFWHFIKSLTSINRSRLLNGFRNDRGSGMAGTSRSRRIGVCFSLVTLESNLELNTAQRCCDVPSLGGLKWRATLLNNTTAQRQVGRFGCPAFHGPIKMGPLDPP